MKQDLTAEIHPPLCNEALADLNNCRRKNPSTSKFCSSLRDRDVLKGSLTNLWLGLCDAVVNDKDEIWWLGSCILAFWHDVVLILFIYAKVPIPVTQSGWGFEQLGVVEGVLIGINFADWKKS